ncbi:hypothetical protein NLG97_g3260 [Lecanicillium saksenae]|uniref:Uncharacterized protein n=1 Tax=Lecanicillium saksenae TaxID=468837 RepID=A0ACC1R0H3_9HYPO|nr:hypothetical protein NLG97_g3260 [Lecanicillium saksenae]
MKVQPNSPLYDVGDGRLSPNSYMDSVDSASTSPSPSTLTSATGLFEVPPAPCMEDNFFYNDDLGFQSDENLWLNMDIGEGSTKLHEMPLSPSGVSTNDYLSDLSVTAPSTPKFETDCSHSEMTERLLCAVMGTRWPVAPSSTAASTSTLSVLRDAVSQLHMLSTCVVCTSSCKSMAIIQVISKAVLEHVKSLVDMSGALDKADRGLMQLGCYSIDSEEECYFVYTQIMRRHVMKFSDVADSFAEASQQAGWLGHVLTLKDIADEARTLSRSDLKCH